MEEDPIVVLRYQGTNGGSLMMDKNGDLLLSTNHPRHPTMAYFKKVLVATTEDETGSYDLVKFVSYDSKYMLTGYGVGEGQVVMGELTEDPFSRSLWEQRSYTRMTGAQEENYFSALYNPAVKEYFVIFAEGSKPEFRLSNDINDVRTNGAFAIGAP